MTKLDHLGVESAFCVRAAAVLAEGGMFGMPGVDELRSQLMLSPFHRARRVQPVTVAEGIETHVITRVWLGDWTSAAAGDRTGVGGSGICMCYRATMLLTDDTLFPDCPYGDTAPWCTRSSCTKPEKWTTCCKTCAFERGVIRPGNVPGGYSRALTYLHGNICLLAEPATATRLRL